MMVVTPSFLLASACDILIFQKYDNQLGTICLVLFLEIQLDVVLRSSQQLRKKSYVMTKDLKFFRAICLLWNFDYSMLWATTLMRQIGPLMRELPDSCMKFFLISLIAAHVHLAIMIYIVTWAANFSRLQYCTLRLTNHISRE